MTDPFDPRRNRLLAAFADDEWQRCRPHLERVDLKLGQVLCESGAQCGYLYFPTSAIVSLLYMSHGGEPLEVAQVGCEGMVGVADFLGGGSTTNSAEVRSAGKGCRIRSDVLHEEFERVGSAMHVLLCYTQALITQIAQNAVCARHHSVEQQLCRWLLLSLDRAGSDELLMTQELIGTRLGVRRESVTEAARHLQAAGLIRYARGHVWVLDRAGLERHSCECYGVIRREYARLLPIERAAPPRHDRLHLLAAGSRRAAPALAERLCGS